MVTVGLRARSLRLELQLIRFVWMEFLPDDSPIMETRVAKMYRRESGPRAAPDGATHNQTTLLSPPQSPGF